MTGFIFLWCLSIIGLPYAALNLPLTVIFLGLSKYRSRRFLRVHVGITLTLGGLFVMAAVILALAHGSGSHLAMILGIVLAYCAMTVGPPLWQYRLLSHGNNE